MNSRNKTNGQAALLAKGRDSTGGALSLNGLGRAASDDASELSVANAAAASAAVRADRQACADVAQAGDPGKRRRARAASPSRTKKDSGEACADANAASAERETQPEIEPLPIDGEAFVDAVHAQVDLVRLEVDLLNSPDDKIVQRELAYLRELRYGKRSACPDDEPLPIIFDAPRPERDLP